mgnify:CR=1 FL=1
MFDTAEMGALFKKFRLSKKLSLKDVAGDFLSISFLSKFERGESEISLSRFFLLLEKLDVSIEEFYGILANERSTNTEKLLDMVSTAYHQGNSFALKKYYKEEMGKYEVSTQKSFLYNAIMIESFLVNLNNKSIGPEKMMEISDYLFSVEQWGKRELIIFGNSLSALNDKVIEALAREILFKTTLFGSNEANQKARIELLINIVAIFLERDLLDLAKDYLDIIQQLGIPETALYDRMEYQFVLGIYLFKSGKKEQGKQKMMAVLATLKTFEAENLRLAHERVYEELVNSII